MKVLRRLELLPRPLGQDWSEIWLQRFSGTVTIWPKSVLSDLYYILSDPNVERLARMIHQGQQSTFPMIKFISNRMKLERLITEGLVKDPEWKGGVRQRRAPIRPRVDQVLTSEDFAQQRAVDLLSDSARRTEEPNGIARGRDDLHRTSAHRRNSVIEELRRQSAVFFDDTDDTGPSEDEPIFFLGQSGGTQMG